MNLFRVGFIWERAPCQVVRRVVKLAVLSSKSTCNLCVAFGVQGTHLAVYSCVQLARVMQMFCVDASMSSGLPFRSHPVLIQILDSITNTYHVGPSLFEMNKYNKQVASLLGICVQNHCNDVVVSFL